MLKAPPSYGDVISFHHINAPFDVLFGNNEFIGKQLNDILKNLNTEYSPLTNKTIFTNGVKEYFFIESNQNMLFVDVDDLNKNIFNPIFIKKYSDVNNTLKTPLTFKEIID